MDLGTCYLFKFNYDLGDPSLPSRVGVCRYTLRWSSRLESLYLSSLSTGSSGIPLFDYASELGIGFSILRKWERVPRSFATCLRRKGHYRRYDPAPPPIHADNRHLFFHLNHSG